MKKSLIGTALALVIISQFWTSCRKDNLQELTDDNNSNNEVCDTSFVLSYSNDVVPILSAECYSCHSTLAAPFLAKGNVLDNYNSLVVFAEDGRLVCVINHIAGCAQMPQGKPKLSDCRIARIEAWVNQGNPNN